MSADDATTETGTETDTGPSPTPLGPPRPDDDAAFWARYLASADLDPDTPAPPSWCFGDSVELADELIHLVLHGPKRATAGSVLEYENDDEPIPRVGDRSIVTDGSRRPRAVLETTDVRIGALSSVDDRFAWDEGEGDRTRGWWLDAHHAYFGRVFAAAGQEFHPDIPVVFERFELVYAEG